MSLHYLCPAEGTRGPASPAGDRGRWNAATSYTDVPVVHRSDRSPIAKPPTAMQRPPVASDPQSHQRRATRLCHGKFNFAQALRSKCNHRRRTSPPAASGIFARRVAATTRLLVALPASGGFPILRGIEKSRVVLVALFLISAPQHRRV